MKVKDIDRRPIEDKFLIDNFSDDTSMTVSEQERKRLKQIFQKTFFIIMQKEERELMMKNLEYCL